MKVYKCNICGNVVELLENGGGELVCCGEPMQEMVAKTTDEGNEKHLPVVNVDGNKVIVHVGSVDHPMTETHYITKIFVVYNNKVIRKDLKFSDQPHAEFVLDEDFDTLDVYEYCNIHGLWKTKYNK